MRPFENQEPGVAPSAMPDGFVGIADGGLFAEVVARSGIGHGGESQREGRDEDGHCQQADYCQQDEARNSNCGISLGTGTDGAHPRKEKNDTACGNDNQSGWDQGDSQIQEEAGAVELDCAVQYLAQCGWSQPGRGRVRGNRVRRTRRVIHWDSLVTAEWMEWGPPKSFPQGLKPASILPHLCQGSIPRLPLDQAQLLVPER